MDATHIKICYIMITTYLYIIFVYIIKDLKFGIEREYNKYICLFLQLYNCFSVICKISHIFKYYKTLIKKGGESKRK